MDIKVKEPNQTAAQAKGKIVKSLYLAVQVTPHQLVTDKFKAGQAITNRNPDLKENKIEFSQENETEIAEKTTVNNGPENIQGRKDLLQETYKKVTANDPLLNDIDIKDEETLALTGSILSAINIPQVEPLKLTVNVLTADAKKDNLKKNIEEKNIEGITTNLVNSGKCYWGTALSGAKFADIVAETSMEIGLVSTGAAANVVKLTGTFSRAANRLALPFAVAGTGLTLWDVKKANTKLTEKQNEIKKFNSTKINGDKFIGRVHTNFQERTLNQQVNDKKINLALKGIGGCLSTISTTALVVSVYCPSKAAVATPVSLVTGVAASISSAMASEKVRKDVTRKMKILKNRYLG